MCPSSHAGRLQSQGRCPVRQAIVCFGRKAQVLARKGRDIRSGSHSARRRTFKLTFTSAARRRLPQSRTAQGMPVFVPAAVFHLMQAIFNTPMLAEKPEQVERAAPFRRPAGQQGPAFPGYRAGGDLRCRLYCQRRLRDAGKPQLLPDLVGQLGAGPQLPHRNLAPFLPPRGLGVRFPQFGSTIPSDRADRAIGRCPFTRTRQSCPCWFLNWGDGLAQVLFYIQRVPGQQLQSGITLK